MIDSLSYGVLITQNIHGQFDNQKTPMLKTDEILFFNEFVTDVPRVVGHTPTARESLVDLEL